MSHLVCHHCGYQNKLYTKRQVFCSQCHHKMANNYFDWQKSKADTSFETYLSQLNYYNEQYRLSQLDKKGLKDRTLLAKSYHFIKSHSSKKTITFLSTVLLQLAIFMFFLNQQQNYLQEEQHITEKNYLKDVKWQNYPITADLSLTLPFKLEKSNSVLPHYLQHYIDVKSKKSESLRSFSITIEDITFDDYHSLNYTSLLPVQDEYMQNANTRFTSQESIQHLVINHHTTYLEQGSYRLDGKKYLYENYTLIQGNKGLKIIISYLQDDKLLSQYADIITKSLYQNQSII